MKFAEIRKTLVAVGVVIVSALHASLSDGTLTLPIASEWVPVVVATVGAFLVWLVRNGEKTEEK